MHERNVITLDSRRRLKAFLYNFDYPVKTMCMRHDLN